MPTRKPLRPAAQVGGLALLALGVRLVQLDHTPFIDELNHVLAAQSLLEDGDLTILDGTPYTRAWLFTALVAGFQALFGASVEVGRLPALLAGVGLVCLLFVWLRRVAGTLAGSVAALLLCFAPISILLSQWVRFYTLHALLFWLGAAGIERATSGDARRWVLPGAVAALAVALHLQLVTLIGLGGLLVWVALVSGPGLLRRGWGSRRRTAVGVGVAGLAGVGIAAAVASGILEAAILRFQTADFWAASRADEVRFYHWLLEDQYGLLWSLWPLMLLLALARAPRTASLFASVFVAALLGHSFAAQKSERYLFYAMPALFAVWGLGLAALVPWLHARLSEALGALPLTLPRPLVRRGVSAALLAAALFAVASILAFQLGRDMLTVTDADWTHPPLHLGERYRGEPDWAAARPKLAPLVREADAVVASHALKAAWYLGRVDYVLYAGRLIAWGGGRKAEFSAFEKVGRPAISTPESLALLMACEPSGLVVVEAPVVGWSGGVPDATAELLAMRAEEVPLPHTRLRAWVWHDAQPDARAACGRIAALRRKPGDGVGAGGR